MKTIELTKLIRHTFLKQNRVHRTMIDVPEWWQTIKGRYIICTSFHRQDTSAITYLNHSKSSWWGTNKIMIVFTPKRSLHDIPIIIKICLGVMDEEMKRTRELFKFMLDG